ncbi:MAG: HipA N-terminal domain-containing protein [Draconibacterium sp.]|nr:HipA N-terminal domain-containing protein [Draconibacterium sp.]
MKEILVFADWIGLPSTLKVGMLRSERSKGEEVFSFKYDDAWLSSGYAQVIDPDLRLFGGPQYLNDNKPNFGLFLDSSPDRWGRMLMERRESVIARKTKQPKKRLLESDFLLGVNDETRMGALRFKLEETDYFRWKKEDAVNYIKRTKETVSHWKKRASSMNISSAEQVMMESAFKV